jgi:hypothetical protein
MKRQLALILTLALAGVQSVMFARASRWNGVTKPAVARGEMAYSTRWQSRVKLGNDISTISNSSFTIMARFFPIYRVPHFGAVVAARGSSGDFAVGQWMVSSENPTNAVPALGLIVGSTQKQFAAQRLLRINEWNYLAVVFKPSTGWQAFLNGVAMGSIRDSGFRAKGELSAGRIAQSDKLSQFYGLIDDVAVFDTALTASQIKTFGELKSFTGSEAELEWGWRFDVGSDVMTTQSQSPVVEGNAVKVGVSFNRSPNDALKMPAPVQAQTYILPFPVDAEYYVVQGNSGNTHHWGPFAFTWDFIYAGKRSDSLEVRKKNGNRQATEAFNKLNGPGQPLTSIADGSVVHANWKFVEGDGSAIPNATIVRHAPGEYSAYFHLQKDSFKTLFPWSRAEFTIAPSNFLALDNGTIPAPAVGAGKKIGGLGGTGMKLCTDCFHLHFGVLDQPDLIGIFNDRISRPIHFAAFETSIDRINWFTMSGIPAEGTFVRRKTQVVG